MVTTLLPPPGLYSVSSSMATERVRWTWRLLPILLLLWLLSDARAGKLYSEADPLFLLNGGNIQRALRNSSSAWVVEFYSSWCGHCVNYAPTWRALANDVKEWYPAIKIGVLDCAEERNYETCKEYEISSYPTFRFFKAFTKEFTPGQSFKAGTEHEIAVVRQMMIDFLQTSPPEHRPPACPPLEPIGSTDVLAFFGENSPHYTAIVFESESSYIGREVILDMIQHENIVVRRALSADKALLVKLSISSAPSCYLIYPNGSHGLINIAQPLRSLFSSHLKALPGVKRRSLSQPTVPVKQDTEEEKEVRDWNQHDRDWNQHDPSKLYMADLESGLHYLLRVELATHKLLDGEKLKTIKDFIAVLSKLFSGRQPVMKLLETLNDWLVNLPLDRIPYDAILDLVNNKMRIAGLFLPSHAKWVGCQGSLPELRGYTCSLWQLFHSMTVQASIQTDAVANAAVDVSAQAVLQIMRRYIQQFFGCRKCAQHFEEMAKESMDSVMTSDDAVLWLWKKHNVVNKRLAGAPSEDPNFPKVQWPTRDLCPLCHGDKESDSWDEAEVLNFLKNFYSTENMSGQFAVEEINESQAEQEVEAGKKEDSVPKEPAKMDAKAIQDSKDASNMKPELIDKQIHNNRPAFKGLVKNGKELVAARQDKHSISFLGIGFSSIDMSLCVVLYVASALFLMIMYFFFRMRSRRWKVRYYRPYV